MKKSLEGWRDRVEAQKKKLMDEGFSEAEAERAVEPSVSFSLGKEEQIHEYEDFYRMEEGLKS